MTKELRPIDVSGIPELLRIAEEVGSTREPRLLRRNRRDLALVVPLPGTRRRPRRMKSKEDMEAFLSSAGGWKDVDTDKLVGDIYESRRRSVGPPVRL
jgi:hypothetical protein